MMAFVALTAAAGPDRTGAGEVLRDLENLRVAGSVLYVAAHPDDENTRLIGYLVGQRGLRTAYLSMTRGDGGQNLIGPEQDAVLGVLRTGELLAARGVDGGEQRFTRMRDFGYSKSAEETLALWDHDEALDDVVRAIRSFRPDVIITRFPTQGDTHGHHLASAILAGEAFTLAADGGYVTEGLGPWAADRLIYNRSRWTLQPGTDTSAWATLDTGVYDPRLGRSYGELAAVSRSMHKSQGFGDAPQVGPIPEYFESVAGTPVDGGRDPFAGMTLDWSRFESTRPLQRALDGAVAAFDPRAPHLVLSRLAKAHALLDTIPDPEWREVQRLRLERVMATCAGLWLTARTEVASVAPGGELPITLTAVARAPLAVELVSAAVPGALAAPAGALANNVPWTHTLKLTVPGDAPLSIPHWLVEPASANRYGISDPAHRVLAEVEPALVAEFVVEVEGARLTLRRPVEFAWTDPVQGERIHPVEVLPAVTATFSAPARVLPADVGSRCARRAARRAAPWPCRLRRACGCRRRRSRSRWPLPERSG
jgi:LmbE family N-acetylglucosaminyl deacetylase